MSSSLASRNLSPFFDLRLEALQTAIRNMKCSSLTKEISGLEMEEKIQSLFTDLQSSKQMIYTIGNGVSASLMASFSVDLMKVLQLSSQSLCEPGLLSCLGNDLGFEQAFSFQVERLIRPKDLLVAMSSSGRSANILQAVYRAKERGAFVLTFSGFSLDCPLRSLGDLNFWVPSSDYSTVQMAHFYLVRSLLDLLKKG